MRIPMAVLALALALALAVAACDNGGGGSKATPTHEGDETPGATVTATATSSATGTPGAEKSPEPQGDAIPAVIPDNLADFLDSLPDVVIVQEKCDYDADTDIVDCGDNGLYQLQDGVDDPEAVCRVMLAEDEPVGVNCQTFNPIGAITYEIPRTP
jgi:hypothetical protein